MIFYGYIVPMILMIIYLGTLISIDLMKNHLTIEEIMIPIHVVQIISIVFLPIINIVALAYAIYSTYLDLKSTKID